MDKVIAVAIVAIIVIVATWGGYTLGASGQPDIGTHIKGMPWCEYKVAILHPNEHNGFWVDLQSGCALPAALSQP